MADEGKVSWFKSKKNFITSCNKVLFDLSRQKVILVPCVGWLLNQSQKEITAKNQMFGHLELLVCEFSQFFISFHFTIWCDIFILMSSFTSIIEKFVCLFSLWNCCTMWTSQRWRHHSSCNRNSVNLIRIYSKDLQHHFNCDWLHCVESTETKDWRPRFQLIVLLFFENWWKCVGRKIPTNVLYPFSFNSPNQSLQYDSLRFGLHQTSRHLRTFVQCFRVIFRRQNQFEIVCLITF
jgi:hypothetical protein